MNILLIEDDPHSRELAIAILQLDGHRIDTTFSGAEALRLAATHPYDMLMVDLGLPDMDGADVIRDMRTKLGVAAPVLVCSAFVEPRFRRDAMEAGADVFLAKPYRRHQLATALADAMEERQRV